RQGRRRWYHHYYHLFHHLHHIKVDLHHQHEHQHHIGPDHLDLSDQVRDANVVGCGASSNRTVFLHGMNMAAKMPPFQLVDLSSTASIAAALDPLQRAGFNFVRLAFTWEAYEPVQGQYNTTYLAQYVAVVKALRQRGIYTLVDFHQDSFSRWSLNGCGEGFPQWTVPSSAQHDPADITSVDSLMAKMCPIWGILEVLQVVVPGDMQVVFNGLLQPGGTVQTAFLAMIGKVAGALVGETGVFAFDVINEPFMVTTHLYEAAAAAIESAGWSAPIVAVEPGTTNSSNTRPNIANVIYAPHHYDTRFEVDAVYLQLKYWVQESGILDAVEAFTDDPSETTRESMMSHVTGLANTTVALTDNLSGVVNGTAYNFTGMVSTVNGVVNTLDSYSKAVVANNDNFLGVVEAWVLKEAAEVAVALLNATLFVPVIGLFPVLSDILPILGPFTDSAVSDLA
ncbi:hypothetical protein HK405_008767, partial [Cladochytrium tenue]